MVQGNAIGTIFYKCAKLEKNLLLMWLHKTNKYLFAHSDIKKANIQQRYHAIMTMLDNTNPRHHAITHYAKQAVIAR